MNISPYLNVAILGIVGSYAAVLAVDGQGVAFARLQQQLRPKRGAYLYTTGWAEGVPTTLASLTLHLQYLMKYMIMLGLDHCVGLPCPPIQSLMLLLLLVPPFLGTIMLLSFQQFRIKMTKCMLEHLRKSNLILTKTHR